MFTIIDDYLYDLSKQTQGFDDTYELSKKWSEDKAGLLKEKITQGLVKQASYLVNHLDPPKDEPQQSFLGRFMGGKVKY